MKQVSNNKRNGIPENYFTHVAENFDPEWKDIYPERIKLIEFFKECHNHSNKEHYENQAIKVFKSMRLENENKVNPKDLEKQFQFSVLHLKDFFKEILITSNKLKETLQKPSENYGSIINNLLQIGKDYGRLERLSLPLDKDPIMLALNMAQEELGISKTGKNKSYGDKLIPTEPVYEDKDEYIFLMPIKALPENFYNSEEGRNNNDYLI